MAVRGLYRVPGWTCATDAVIAFDMQTASDFVSDDAIDHFLTVITDGKVTTDQAGAHSDLLTEFPCLGPPHTAAARSDFMQALADHDHSRITRNCLRAYSRTEIRCNAT